MTDDPRRANPPAQGSPAAVSNGQRRGQPTRERPAVSEGTRRTYPRVDVYRPEPLAAAEFARRMRQQRRVAAYEDWLLRPALDWGRIALATYAVVGWALAFALLVAR